MNNFTKDIERARQIIVEYYDGQSTPDDLSWVKLFLASVEIDRLPSDLKSDAEIFRIMNADVSAIECSVPDNLEERIRALITEAPMAENQSSRKGVVLRFVAWASAAAAAILLIISVFSFSQQPDGLKIGGEVVAALETEPDEDGYIEISNANDAEKIISGSMNLATEKMEVAYNSVTKTDNKIKKIDAKLNKILNNKSLKTS